MVMFRVLTGLTPFTNDTDQMVARRLLNGDRPTIADHVGAHYAELMRHCWAMSAQARPHLNEIVCRLGTEPFLEGLDIDAVKEYQARVCPEHLIPTITNEFVNQQRKMWREVIAYLPLEELRRRAGPVRRNVGEGRWC
jgi:hypothetical protein